MSETVNVRIAKLNENARIPEYATQGAAGMDLHALLELDLPFPIYAGEYELISTGLAIELPPGYEAQVRPRSGLAAKHGVTVLNTPGTIDADYRGEIKVILINHGKYAYYVNNGDRIAQLVIAPVIQVKFEVVTNCDHLSETPRGSGGCGSTGLK